MLTMSELNQDMNTVRNTGELPVIPEDMLSPFDSIKEMDDEGRDIWNSRKLAHLLGYQKYWNFERLMEKAASFLQIEKGLELGEQMVEIEEMARLNNGGWRNCLKWLHQQSIITCHKSTKVEKCNCLRQFEIFEFLRTIATPKVYFYTTWM